MAGSRLGQREGLARGYSRPEGGDRERRSPPEPLRERGARSFPRLDPPKLWDAGLSSSAAPPVPWTS